MEPGAIVFAQRQLLLYLAVARCDPWETLGLCHWIVRALDERLRFDPKKPGQQDHRSLARMAEVGLDMRHRGARQGQPIGELLLSPSSVSAQAADAAAENLQWRFSRGSYSHRSGH